MWSVCPYVPLLFFSSRNGWRPLISRVGDVSVRLSWERLDFPHCQWLLGQYKSSRYHNLLQAINYKPPNICASHAYAYAVVCDVKGTNPIRSQDNQHTVPDYLLEATGGCGRCKRQGTSKQDALLCLLGPQEAPFEFLLSTTTVLDPSNIYSVTVSAGNEADLGGEQ